MWTLGGGGRPTVIHYDICSRGLLKAQIVLIYVILDQIFGAQYLQQFCFSHFTLRSRVLGGLYIMSLWVFVFLFRPGNCKM